jgi:hypothetical protein
MVAILGWLSLASLWRAQVGGVISDGLVYDLERDDPV